ncbi:MAG: penicillin-binding transpeptidase domain-containing protein, partial [Acidimicrobiales bacterium]
MNRQIRLLGLGIMALFVALFVNLNYLQLVHAKALDNNPLNAARVVNEYNQPRGAIISADGVTLADSVLAPKGSAFKYERMYPTGPLFGDITGYYSFIYGSSGVESTYNDILTGANDKSGFPTNLTSLRQLLTERSAAQNVTLTISDKLQRLARSELAGRTGSVVALDPSTGAVLAMYSNPSYNPQALSQLSTTKEQVWWKRLLHNPANPLLAGSFRNRWPPGSSF